MRVQGSDGTPLLITKDKRAHVVAVTHPDMHVMADEGQAWTLPFKQAAGANITDNVVFYFENTSSKKIDFHGIFVSSQDGGEWTLECGKSYTSGGTPVGLRQLDTLSGKTQSIVAYYGQAIVIGGTGIDVIYMSSRAGEDIDLLRGMEALKIRPSGTFAVRFKANTTGALSMSGTPALHGQMPWESNGD